MIQSTRPSFETPDAIIQRSDFAIATVTATFATASDFLMLFAAFALQTAPQPAPLPVLNAILWVGGLIGLATIPFFALGYRGIARVIQTWSGPRARVVLVGGVGVALVGALVHLLTLFVIRASVAVQPDAIATDSAINMLTLAFWLAWAVASLLVMVVSIAILAAGLARRHAPPPWLAWLNPATTTIALGLIALPWESGRDLLLPAAPNLAHAIFFTAALIHALYGHKKGLD